MKYRIILELDRGYAYGPSRLVYMSDTPDRSINDDGWIELDRADMVGQYPIGMPETGQIRINPVRIVWWSSTPVGLQGAIA